ncbi:MAG TPA: MFS transporter [Candidatus Saccharimonadales bacterium]|jgi:MFS family permease|nr:MFS transporter [Candidatus Saccharimonadales bacterium]
MTRIHKIYLSNFLTGLVFWYGIEKLFMRSIGIDAVGVGVATAVYLIFNLLCDIPAGIVADKWSRKGVLITSALALAICSALLGNSHSLFVYAIGELFYGLYIVSTSGTYAAITYDILHEEGRAEQYSKIAGRAYALFLIGASVANVVSGFLAHHFGYRFTYFVTIASCVVNVALLLSLREPTFHKAEKKERMLRQLKAITITLGRVQLVRSLTIILTALAIAELFKSEFGQLYMLRYFSAPQIIGLLWAAYAFTWALGSLIAHHMRTRLSLLILGTTVPFILMAFIDTWISVALFMVQSVASAALINQIETRIQEQTPSNVRASILSVVSTFGRMAAVPASFVLGWIFRDFNALWAMRCVAIIAIFVLGYWLVIRPKVGVNTTSVKSSA